MIKKSLKKRFFAVLMCLVLVASCFPLAVFAEDAESTTDATEVVPNKSWDMSKNLFSTALLDIMKINGVAKYLSYSVGDEPGFIKVNTGYTSKTVNLTAQGTISSLITSLGYDSSIFTGNVLSVSDEHISVSCGGVLYDPVDGLITFPDNATLLNAKFYFKGIPDGYVFEYPFIAIGEAYGYTLNFNTWKMPGYTEMEGYRDVMPEGVPLSQATNLLTYELLTTYNDIGEPYTSVGGPYTSLTYSSFGKMNAALPEDIFYYEVPVSKLLADAGITDYGDDLVLSFGGIFGSVVNVNIPYPGSDSMVYSFSAGSHFFFESVEEMLSASIFWNWFADSPTPVTFPYIAYGYVWNEDDDGNALSLNVNTWPVFSDFKSVPGFDDLEYTPLTSSSNLLSYEWFDEYLPSWLEMSTPSDGIFEFVCTDATKYGTQVNIGMGTVADLFRLADYTYVPGSFDIFTVHGLNFSSSLGKSTFRFIDVVNNFPVVYYPSRDWMSIKVTDADFSTFHIQWNLWISTNGVVTIQFPYASPGHVFLRDQEAKYLPLDASSWPQLGNVEDVPGDLTYADGYNAGYAAGLKDGGGSGSYDEGYNAGLSAGHMQGYQEGYDAGELAGYDRGYLAGYEAGAAGSGSGEGDGGSYNDGFLAGYASGRELGYAEGYAAGKQDGYSQGFNAGKQEGYDEGYAAGSGLTIGQTFNPMALWKSVTVTVRYAVETSEGHFKHGISWTVFNNPIDINYYSLITDEGFLNTAGVVEYLLEDVAPSYDGMDWDEPRYVEDMFTIIEFSEDLTTDLYTYSYSYAFESTDRVPVENVASYGSSVSFTSPAGNYFYTQPHSIERYGAYSYQFSVARSEATRSITVRVSGALAWVDQGLNNGILFKVNTSENTLIYNTGYDDGYNSAGEEKYNNGLADGYKNGFIAGKSEALQISKNGDWRDLIVAVVEVPINSIQSLFSFEILGLDMRAAFGAILSLCVLLYIIKKVLM